MEQKYCSQCNLSKDLTKLSKLQYKETFGYIKQNGRKYYQQNKGKYKEHYQKFLKKILITKNNINNTITRTTKITIKSIIN